MYSQLTGIQGGVAEGICVHTVDQIVNGLKLDRVCGTAGDNGSIAAWVMDNGDYSAAFYQFGNAIVECNFISIKALQGWLEIYIKKCI